MSGLHESCDENRDGLNSISLHGKRHCTPERSITDAREVLFKRQKKAQDEAHLVSKREVLLLDQRKRSAPSGIFNTLQASARRCAYSLQTQDDKWSQGGNMICSLHEAEKPNFVDFSSFELNEMRRDISSFTRTKVPTKTAEMKANQAENMFEGYKVPALSASSSNNLPLETEFRGRDAMHYKKKSGSVALYKNNSEDPMQSNDRRSCQSPQRTSHKYHYDCLQDQSQQNTITSMWNAIETKYVKTKRSGRQLEANKMIPVTSAAPSTYILSSKNRRASFTKFLNADNRPYMEACNPIKECFSEQLVDELNPGKPNNGMICQFCGLHGHLLAECLETTYSELVELDRRSFIECKLGTQMGDVICLRCLGKGHWGSECQLENDKLFAHTEQNELKPSKRQMVEHETGMTSAYCRENINFWSHKMGWMRKLPDPMEKWHSRAVAVNGRLTRIAINSSTVMQIKHIMLNKRSEEHILENGVTYETAESGGNTVNTLNKAQFESSKLISSSHSDVLELIEANRLSRTDLFELANNADVSLCAKGYFVRVRYGNWEEELGGTGYRMARIEGIDVNLSAKLLSMVVDLGDIECKVGSRYVSNQGFTQEELVEWLKGTTLRGKTVPQRNDLQAKYKERQAWTGFKAEK